MLIGEADDGCCGHNWLTFGNPAFRDDPVLGAQQRAPPLSAPAAGADAAPRAPFALRPPSSLEGSEGGPHGPAPGGGAAAAAGARAAVAPYEEDGFERFELERLSRLQLSRYDCASFVGNSRTLAFRRRGASAPAPRAEAEAAAEEAAYAARAGGEGGGSDPAAAKRAPPRRADRRPASRSRREEWEARAKGARGP